MITVVKKENLSVEISNSRHSIVADVDSKVGGDDTGLNPHELLEASLGACTNITILMVAKRKGWPLTDVKTVVKIIKEEEENIIKRELTLVGDLSEDQKVKLIEIANKCPMHNFLERKTIVETEAL